MTETINGSTNTNNNSKCSCSVKKYDHTGCISHGHCLHAIQCIVSENCPSLVGCEGYDPCSCDRGQYRPFEYRHLDCRENGKCVHSFDCLNWAYRNCPSFYDTEAYKLETMERKRDFTQRMIKREADKK